MSSLARRWRWIALGTDLSLVMLVLVWQLSPLPTIEGAIKALVLCIPLALPLLGIYNGNRYTYRWATLCVLPYFLVGLTEVVANPTARLFAAVMLILALAWFVALVAFLRVTTEASVASDSA